MGKNLSDIKLLSHASSFIRQVSFPPSSYTYYFLYSYFFRSSNMWRCVWWVRIWIHQLWIPQCCDEWNSTLLHTSKYTHKIIWTEKNYNLIWQLDNWPRLKISTYFIGKPWLRNTNLSTKTRLDWLWVNVSKGGKLWNGSVHHSG